MEEKNADPVVSSRRRIFTKKCWIIYPLVQTKEQVVIGQGKNGLETGFQQQVLWRTAESF